MHAFYVGRYVTSSRVGAVHIESTRTSAASTAAAFVLLVAERDERRASTVARSSLLAGPRGPSGRGRVLTTRFVRYP
jgi:hypothetical protein